MFYELSKTQYSKINTLFAPVDFQLFCKAVLVGKNAGRVFVDDLERPDAAFMITRAIWVFIVGNPENGAFNRALNLAIQGREIIADDAFGMLISAHPSADWVPSQGLSPLGTICAPAEPIPNPRRHYIIRSMPEDWKPYLPDGFELRFIDEEIRDMPGLDQDVVNLLDARRAVNSPDQAGFGFVALHSGKVVAHAVVDVIVGTVGDIGLVTQEAYRRRGLATAVSGAALAYGLSHGLCQIDWDCAIYNTGSVRTAEKLGGVVAREHDLFFVDFAPVGSGLE